MDCVKTILVASDGSGHSRHAEMRAAMLAAALKADIVEVTSACGEEAGQRSTFPSQPCTAGIEDAAIGMPDRRNAVPALALHVPHVPRHAERARQPVRVPGDGPAAIVDCADAFDADLTVVAARREGFLAGVLARFRNDELIRLGDRPVLLVNREPAAAYRKVLVGVDFSAESQQAARVALAVAPGAQFTFLHVFHVPEEAMMNAHGVSRDTIYAYRIQAREEARVRLNDFIDALGAKRQLIYRAIRHGMPGPAIDAHAREIHADLIVVGKHGKSRFIDLFLGSVTQRLIDHVECDMLVTSSPHEGQPDIPPAA